MAAKVFDEDFGHPFSPHDANDGLQEHFERMEFHASVAKSLAQTYGDDAAKLAALFSTPLKFTIENPYEPNECRSEFDEQDFDCKCECCVSSLIRSKYLCSARNQTGNRRGGRCSCVAFKVIHPFPFSLAVNDAQSYYDGKILDNVVLFQFRL
jgi:hypothetical protein